MKGHLLGLVSKRSHYRHDLKPKVMYNTKLTAQKAASALAIKHGSYFSNYKCIYCDGYHIGKNRENKKQQSMIKEVWEVSKVALPRTRYEVLSKMMEEVGELSQEVGIVEGYQKRKAGKDGVLGESIDVIVTAIDLIHVDNPNITEEEIMNVLKVKLGKWHSYIPVK